MDSKFSEKKIASLWIRKMREKGPVATGVLEWNGAKIKVALWKNRSKQEGDKRPDLILEIDDYEPRQAGPATQGQTTAQAPSAQTNAQNSYSRPAQQWPDNNPLPEDCPF